MIKGYFQGLHPAVSFTYFAAVIGMGLALVAGRRISLKGRSLVREALNVESLEGMVRLVRAILLAAMIFGLAKTGRAM